MFKIPILRVLPFLFAALVISPLAAITPISSAHAQDAYSSLSPTAQNIVDAINQARANAGRQPLRVSALLNLAAQSHANDVNAFRIFGHTGSDGSNVRFRVRRVGYNSDWVGENWILTSTPGEAMRWWMSDPPHAENILHGNYTEIGVGEIQDSATGLTFWVTDFARSADGGTSTNDMQSASAAAPLAVAPVVRSVPAGGLDYTIQPGDTLLVIGLQHGLDWETVASANGLNGRSILQIGQTIRIPGGGAVGGLADQPSRTTSTEDYTIKTGDTLAGIATRYGISWQELAAMNGLGEWAILQIGQSIQVPGDAASESTSVEAVEIAADIQSGVFIAVEAPAPAPSAVYYTVREGDTIFSIAIRNRLDWLQLLRLNGMNENSILQPGQQIRLK